MFYWWTDDWQITALWWQWREVSSTYAINHSPLLSWLSLMSPFKEFLGKNSTTWVNWSVIFFLLGSGGGEILRGSHDFHWRGQRSNLSSLTEYTSKGGKIENWLPWGGGVIIYSEYFCTIVQSLRGNQVNFNVTRPKSFSPLPLLHLLPLPPENRIESMNVEWIRLNRNIETKFQH